MEENFARINAKLQIGLQTAGKTSVLSGMEGEELEANVASCLVDIFEMGVATTAVVARIG